MNRFAKYVAFVAVLASALFITGAAKANPPGQGSQETLTKEKADARYLRKEELCEAVKECKEETAKTPTVRWQPDLICSGNLDEAETKRTSTCVCKPGNYPFTLNYGWKPSSRYGGPNVRYFKVFVRCDMSASDVAEKLNALRSQVVTTKSLEEILKKQRERDAGQDTAIAKAQQTADGAQRTANEALTQSESNKQVLATKADKSELNRIRFVPGVGLAYMHLPGSDLFMGTVDVGIGGMWNDSHGISAGGRFMFSPGSFNTSTYPNGKSGQVWGGGAYLHFDSVLHETKTEDGRKRVMLGVGPMCTQMMRVHGDKHFQSINCGADIGLVIGLTPHMALTVGLSGGYSVANRGPQEKAGPFVILGIGLSGTF